MFKTNAKLFYKKILNVGLTLLNQRLVKCHCFRYFLIPLYDSFQYCSQIFFLVSNRFWDHKIIQYADTFTDSPLHSQRWNFLVRNGFGDFGATFNYRYRILTHVLTPFIFIFSTFLVFLWILLQIIKKYRNRYWRS